MQLLKIAGPNAATRKYDLITALGTYALAQDKHEQRLVLRLLTLITARYNWSRNELAVGQREIARLWSVDERTVKREMAKLRAKGWLIVRKQGARGRVTMYSIDHESIHSTTEPTWANVGPDFDLRMRATPETSHIVPLPVKGSVPAPDISDENEWTLAKAILHTEDQGTYGSWLRALVRSDRAGGRLTLRAPSRFHGAYVQTHLSGRILAACQSVDADVSEIVISL